MSKGRERLKYIQTVTDKFGVVRYYFRHQGHALNLWGDPHYDPVARQRYDRAIAQIEHGDEQAPGGRSPSFEGGTRVVNVRLPAELYGVLAGEARRRGRSLSREIYHRLTVSLSISGIGPGAEPEGAPNDKSRRDARGARRDCARRTNALSRAYPSTA